MSLHGEQKQKLLVLFTADPANLSKHNVPSAHVYFQARQLEKEITEGWPSYTLHF